MKTCNVRPHPHRSPLSPPRGRSKGFYPPLCLPICTTAAVQVPVTKLTVLWALLLALVLPLLLAPLPARASIAFGSINNFDAVNDTGFQCHGFEIELVDIHSTDITYTYDWNHYGIPIITEDKTDPLHPRVFVRYQSAKNADGTWAAFTAVPSGPISPTDGHQFTNPAVNFGGEHFGVGFYGAPSAIKYNWLVDNGSGTLVYGGAVNIATPTFTYYPPAAAAPAQVQAAIVPPPPPAPPVLEFGEASWVKETRTSSHNNKRVELRDLVSDDPEDPNDKNWTNGEPDEVEVEWQLLQTEFNSQNGGANGELVGAAEDLPNGDEVITRRYDFFKYVGPFDTETGEALADSVGPDGIHGVGIKNINGVDVDLSTVVVVGEYIGAQMAGFDPAGQIGLIDHLQDGDLNVPYVERSIVIGGTPPITTTTSGTLPTGMVFDAVSGVLSGTPTTSGSFIFTVHSTDASAGDVQNTYRLTILQPGVEQQPHVTITTASVPSEGGTTSGGGEVITGASATVLATANPGFAFVNWRDGGTVVSSSPSYQFTTDVNRKLEANFLHTFTVTPSAIPTQGGSTSGEGTFVEGATISVFAAPNLGYKFVKWTEGDSVLSSSPRYTFTLNADRAPAANFALLTYSISTSAQPPSGGTTSGGGTLNVGRSVTVVAEPEAGYRFLNWTEGGSLVSAAAAYTFTVAADRSLTANFEAIPPPIAIRKLHVESPIIGGDNARGIVTLSDRAPSEGLVVVLASSNSKILRVPASVTIAAGRKSAVFKIETANLREPECVTVHATAGDSDERTTVKIIPRKRKKG